PLFLPPPWAGEGWGGGERVAEGLRHPHPGPPPSRGREKGAGAAWVGPGRRPGPGIYHPGEGERPWSPLPWPPYPSVGKGTAPVRANRWTGLASPVTLAEGAQLPFHFTIALPAEGSHP